MEIQNLPVKLTYPSSLPNSDAYEVPDSDDRNSVVGFRVVHVFDIEQTDGDALPALASGDPGQALANLEAVIQRNGIALNYEELSTGLEGYSAGGKIVINDQLQVARRFSVLAHELAHEWLDLFRVMELLYEDESEAANALLHFHNSLQSDDQISSALRDEYSIEGMLDFIDRFANRENVLGLRWPTRVRIATGGLQFEMPDGRWSDIHVESVSNTYNWTKVTVDIDAESADLDQVAASAYPLSPLAYTIRSHFGLSHDANWEGVGRVFREDGLRLWLPDD